MRVNDISFGVSTEDFDFTVQIFPRNPITLCEISAETTGLLSYGLGVCKHGDPYDRETGCRMALKSALARYDGMFDYCERKAIWDEYLDLFPAPDRLPQRSQRAVEKLLSHVFGQLRCKMTPNDMFVLRQMTTRNGR